MASGNRVDRSHAFVALTEAWANYEIDMREFGRRFGRMREERPEHRPRILSNPMPNPAQEATLISDDDSRDELARISNANEKE
jgi:hypothetical protein